MERQVTKAQREADKEIVASMQQMTYSGPLPPASELAGYKKVQADAPERIMRMAEEEQKHRHEIDCRMLKAGRAESLLGQVLAFVIVLAFLASAVYLAMQGHEWVSVTLIGIISALAMIFYLKKTPNEK